MNSVAGPNECQFFDKIIQDGQNTEAFLEPVVRDGQTCKSERRTCQKGVLSGQYEYPHCQVGTQLIKAEVSETKLNINNGWEAGCWMYRMKYAYPNGLKSYYALLNVIDRPEIKYDNNGFNYSTFDIEVPRESISGNVDKVALVIHTFKNKSNFHCSEIKDIKLACQASGNNVNLFSYVITSIPFQTGQNCPMDICFTALENENNLCSGVSW